jgi:hypothetical protein
MFTVLLVLGRAWTAGGQRATTPRLSHHPLDRATPQGQRTDVVLIIVMDASRSKQSEGQNLACQFFCRMA